MRKRPSQVHKAIFDTIKERPDQFGVLNSGIVIVARDCEIDEKNKNLRLTRPSIINGSQTQGVLKDYFKEFGGEGAVNAHIKFEVVVTNDEGLIAEISIARNFQNDVMTISIAGRLGQLDELEKAFMVKKPESKLQKSETKLSDDYVKTERLLQVITALIPEQLWVKKGDFNKVYAYSMKAKCLKDFQEIHDKAHNPADPEHVKYRELNQFFLDICSDAYDLYNKWKKHQGFHGTGIRAIEREGHEIVEVPDGIIFPILASLSAFAVKTDNGWQIQPPEIFKDEELIRTAKSVYMEIADHNPQTMGKNKACYSALYQITQIYGKLSTMQNGS